MKKLLEKQYARFGHAFSGLWIAYRTDFNFKLQVWLLVPFLILIYVCRPLSETEFLLMGLSYALILTTELQNTSFEKALNRLHPELHHTIGASKDVAAAAVLVAGVFALLVCTTIFVVRL